MKNVVYFPKSVTYPFNQFVVFYDSKNKKKVKRFFTNSQYTY
jgi:hypothetical protein